MSKRKASISFGGQEAEWSMKIASPQSIATRERTFGKHRGVKLYIVSQRSRCIQRHVLEVK